MFEFPKYIWSKITNADNDKTVDIISDVHGTDRLAVSIRPLGEVDTGNSTTTPLGISGVYTGTWHDVIDAIHIAVLVTSDVASSTDGVRVEWSSDGSTVLDADAFNLDAGATKIWTFGPHTKYYRVKYTNGTSAQSTFEISSIIKTAYQKSSSHRVQETISNEDDAELVKAVLTGEDSDGVFQNVRVNSSGELLTTVAKVSNVVHEYDGWDATSPKLSYTVPAGKVLWITGWNIAARSDAAGHTFALKSGSTEFSWITVNNDGTTSILRSYPANSPFEVAAGVVVTCARIDGSTTEEWSVELDGYLEDV